MMSGLQPNSAVHELAEPQLRPLEVGKDSDWPSDQGLDLADIFDRASVVMVRAMAEVNAEYVCASQGQLTDFLDAPASRAEGGDDSGSARADHA